MILFLLCFYISFLFNLHHSNLFSNLRLNILPLKGGSMWKKITVLLMLLLFFTTNSNLPVKAAVTEPKNVLIINSYHPGFDWTDDQTSGILSSLTSLDMEYNVSIEYLDWKQYPTEANISNAYNSMKLKYSSKKIDVIMCTDDAAFSFALKYRSEIFSDAPIVFSGVNSSGLATIAKDQTNFTGVLEELNPESTIKVALNINPSIKNIYLVYDNTESGLSTGALCLNAAKNIDSSLNVISLNNMSSSEIIDSISKIDKNSMVLITTYFMDTDGNNVDHELFCEKLSNASPIPIFHLYDFSLNSGIFGGDLIMGKVQCEEASSLAIRILHGEQASSIAVTDKNANSYIFDYNILKKYNISKSDLPKESQFINTPFSFIDTYRTLVYTVLFIFLLLISFTIILLFHIRKIRVMRLNLLANNEELTQLYEELSATEEELRAQYVDVSEAQSQLVDYSSELHHLAYHDILTGLYNRLYLYEIVEKELTLNSCIGALFFIDLDNFKFVNDTLGHNLGDELLKSISVRLLKISSEKNALIRLGGDEFVFFSSNLKNKATAQNFANKISKYFIEPFNILGNILTVTVSIGIALCPDNGTTVDTLLRNADMAMFKVKNNGKNGFFFFNNILKDKLLDRVNIENNFKKALSHNEFQLYYQPQIIASTNTIDGFEALLRWNSPELGMLPPLKFISIAEETGFIKILGEWILKSACTYIKDLNKRKNKKYKISVNISVIQLLQDNFVDIVKQVLISSRLSPDLLELEITESIIMGSPELVVEKIKVLRHMGIRIALDDFGTGYSSLSYLRTIPITTLKIDKLFIDDISNPKSNTDVTDAIIDLGHKMNLSIVAEGVETEEQLQYLKKNNCDKIQGYLFSKPLPIAELEIMIIEHEKTYTRFH